MKIPGKTDTEKQAFKQWTVLEILKWTSSFFDRKGIATARLDAEILLAHVLDCSRVNLYLNHDRPLESHEREAYRNIVKRRSKGEPAAYILGKKEFYGKNFRVNKHVLIPRPETELIVDIFIEKYRKIIAERNAISANGLKSSEEKFSVLDLCTGCGCIGISLAASFPELFVTCTDISREACLVAEKNAEDHKLEERITFLPGDLFEPLSIAFNAIVCNPPYIASSEISGLMKDVKNFEPRAALEGGILGYEILIKIINQAPEFIRPEGFIILEHGEGQGEILIQEAQKTGCYKNITSTRDFGGTDRIFSADIISQHK